ncbi:hypothetical protein [Agrobacterium sp.]|uniref:hypothetical protein n=1 Tax=Agrobacterium sp. TaxID=361 RepID=UPI0028A58FB0|nr:hypothetical protein [Agrobacterium sp.]
MKRLMACTKALVYVQSLAIVVLVSGFASVAPAQELNEATLKAGVAAYGDAKEARRVEAEVSGYVKSGDMEGLIRLAEDIQTRDGELLNILTAILEQQGEGVSEEFAALAVDPHQIALSIGPCHHANVAIRMLAMMIADSAEPVIQNDVIMVDGTQLDDVFADSMNHCERMNQLPQRATEIGSSCAVTAACEIETEVSPSP